MSLASYCLRITILTIQSNNFSTMLFSLAVGLIVTALFTEFKPLMKLGIIYIVISVIYAYSNYMTPFSQVVNALCLLALPFTFLFTGFYLKSQQGGISLDINSIPDIFRSKLRIAIVCCLMTGEKTFKEVKAITGATDGNLSVQMSKLEESGYVSIHKDFFSNKPRTRYNLTGKGKKEFIDYVNALDKVIRQYNDGE